MTLDEAIAHEREFAERYSNFAIVYHSRNIPLADDYKICADNHELLAKWLEELKSYRASVFSGDMTQAMLKEEYCKAIDDFAEEVKNLIINLNVIRFNDIDKIAGQLKEGDGE